jgi:ABC-2 type transport system permease protein
MNKISVIVEREYLSRVKKKSFIIMTLLAPLLMASLFIVPALIMSSENLDFKKIAIVEDGSDLFKGVLQNRDDIEFDYLEGVNVNDLKETYSEAGYYGVLYISPVIATVPSAVQLISKKQPPIGLLDYISSSMEKELEKQKLAALNIENLDEILKSIRSKVNIQTIQIDETGAIKETSTGIAMALAYLSAFLMYMLVFVFGAQVMRGVIEEKTSRVVEVIVSSVKPVQLMLGKIIGIGLVGLTQFALWALFTAGIVFVLKTALIPKDSLQEIVQSVPQSVLSTDPQTAAAVTELADSGPLSELTGFIRSAANQNWALIIPSFIFYFLTGYFLYASIFAAIGSAVDNETETQQFMMPVTIPIILGLLVAMGTMQNPESSLAFWCSLIPLTSPIVMMARLPFGVPGWEIALSMGLMVVTFLGFVWMAAKIYRTGILMYGKKASYKELWKWMKYKS